MSRKVPFSRLARFTGDAERDLALLEGNVAAKLRADDVQEWGPLTIVQLVSGTYTAKAWDVVECNPPAAGTYVVLPDPKLGNNVSSWIGVKNTSSANTVTIVTQSGTLIDTASSLTLSAGAFAWVYSNGQTWRQALTSGTITLAGDVTGPAGSNTVVKLQNRSLAATAPAVYQLLRSLDGSTWQPSYEGYPEASAVTTFSLSAGNVDTVVFTVPASPTGNGRFVLQRVHVRLTTALGVADTGTVAVRVGTSVGGNDIATDQTINNASAVGIVFSGLSIATRGSAMLAANGYELSMAAGATVNVRATTTGTITAGACTAYVYGAFLP